jgi:hypothetical protein
MRLLELFRPYHAILTRRVSDEEQISVEVFARSRQKALADMREVLAACREHKKAHNQDIVRVTQEQLAHLDTAIHNRQIEIADLDAQIAKRKQHPSLRAAK